MERLELPFWYWWIQSVYVMPPHRGKGVLKAMYETVKDMARQEGVSILRLYVDKSSTTAQKAYSKLKMSETHCLMYETEAWIAW
jgi:GNAT superfamily N-acetyltransferase